MYVGPHPTIIVYGVKNLQKLRRVSEHLKELRIENKEFYEPDRDENDTLTAIATLVRNERVPEFKKYQLL